MLDLRHYRDVPKDIYTFDTFSQAKAVAAVVPDFFFRCNVCDEIHLRSDRHGSWNDNELCCRIFAEKHGANFEENILIWLPYMELILAIKKDSPELPKIKMKIMYFDKDKKYKGRLWLPVVEGD